MSRKAPTDAPKKCLFCEVRQGGGAYGKSASGAAFPGVSFFAHMFFPGLSPGSVDNRVSVFEKGESARRSRTTERSESVSEEAEERLNWHFLLTHLCGISHRTWRTFHTIRTDAEWLSQYTHRYRSVNWVRAAPRHPKGQRPDAPWRACQLPASAHRQAVTVSGSCMCQRFSPSSPKRARQLR